MTRYHVDTPAKLVRVQVALDQSFQLRDAAEKATPREQMVYRAGAFGLASQIIGPAHSCYDLPGTHWPLIDGGDGTAALQIADAPSIDAKLGRTVNGLVLPTVGALVQVTRPRDASLLPTAVCAKLDDAYVSGQLAGTDIAGQAKDTPAARTAVTAELQTRATAVLARYDAAKAQAALDAAIGLGKAGG